MAGLADDAVEDPVQHLFKKIGLIHRIVTEMVRKHAWRFVMVSNAATD